MLNWRTSNAGCRPSCDYVRGLLYKIIRKTKSQAKPKSVKQENKAKPVVESKMTFPKKLKKKASTQQDSMKSKNSEIVKPSSVNKDLKKKAMKDASSSQNKVSKSMRR